MITKQNVSRTLKELSQHGMVTTIVNKGDKRSEIVVLTEIGKQTVLEAYVNTFKLLDTYSDLVGVKELNITIIAINKILAYHSNQSKLK